jgi:hypothetical protein
VRFQRQGGLIPSRPLQGFLEAQPALRRLAGPAQDAPAKPLARQLVCLVREPGPVGGRPHRVRAYPSQRPDRTCGLAGPIGGTTAAGMPRQSP